MGSDSGSNLPAWLESPVWKAVHLEPTERVPIWLMRQAGRYLPEYRAIRRRIPFDQLCRNSELCAEIMLTTVERLGVDAAIVFADLLPILQPMGLQLEYPASRGPVIRNPLREPREVDRLRELESLEGLEFVLEAVRRTRAGLAEHLPLIGFAGAPFTLACYAIEGGASRDYARVKAFMHQDPGAWKALLDRLARAVARFLNAQIEAGAQLVQLFDTWAGCLGPDDYRSAVLPFTRAVIQAVRPHTPVIYFATGNPALLPLMSESGAGVIGVDWRVRLDEAWQAIGHHKAIQGNLDPAVLLAPQAEIRRRAQQILEQAAGRPGHIFNLGHGVLPQTPVENVCALIRTVQQWWAK